MSLEIFLLLLLVISTFTALVTEAVKLWLAEREKTYRANALAGYVAIVLSVAVCAGYAIMTNALFTAQLGVYLVALIFLSWLSAMVGYDKVVQAISQFKTKG